MSKTDYIHGYDTEERERLVEQAEFWRDRLILPGLDYRPGDRVLEVGCAVGATLATILEAFPGIRVAGIDIEERQIAAATDFFESLGHENADLRHGDASRMPWKDATFDHIYIMWVLEHVPVETARIILGECLRVLKPGGTITLTETDYDTFRTYPDDPDVEYLYQGLDDLFARKGNPIVGRMLGPLLLEAGFGDVGNGPVGFHFFKDPANDDLRVYIGYIAAFTEAAIPQMREELDLDEARLLRGLKVLKAIPDHPMGAAGQIVFRAKARR